MARLFSDVLTGKVFMSMMVRRFRENTEFIVQKTAEIPPREESADPPGAPGDRRVAAELDRQRVDGRIALYVVLVDFSFISTRSPTQISYESKAGVSEPRVFLDRSLLVFSHFS